MAGSSNVIVLEPDARAAAQLRVGFAREGIAVVTPAIPADVAALSLDAADAGIALVGGTGDHGVALVRRARALLPRDVPIAFVGTAPREAAVAAGADETVAHPAFLRDVVTIARVFRGQPAAERENVAGSLAETSGLYTLVRAIATLQRSAVLTLIRGLRRGEVRFYRGEITSAHVGLIHGQAAFHQLLLWTDAHFELQREDAIVRRAQIPLGPDELFADAERFLEGVRQAAERLSPSMVLEVHTAAVTRAGADVPSEIHAILRMFDGHHVLADILEDSPYRVFETLRIAQTALDAGLLRVAAEPKPRASWRAVLAIDEWLVGSETRDAVVERVAEIDSKPVAAPRKSKKRRKQKQRTTGEMVRAAGASAGAVNGGAAAVAEAAAVRGKIDWRALVPRATGDVGGLAGVVPAANAAGEIQIATRDKDRERLEALMDTDKRSKIFPTEIGIEPSVVVDPDVTSPVPRITAPAATVEPPPDATPPPAAAVEPLPDTTPLPAVAVEPLANAAAPAAGEAADAEARAEAEARASIGADEVMPSVVVRPSEIEEARAYAAKVLAEAEAAREPVMLHTPPPVPDVPVEAPSRPSRPSDATSLVKDLLAVAPSVDPEPAPAPREASVLAGTDAAVADLVAVRPLHVPRDPEPRSNGFANHVHESEQTTSASESIAPSDSEPSAASSIDMTLPRPKILTTPPPAAEPPEPIEPPLGSLEPPLAIVESPSAAVEPPAPAVAGPPPVAVVESPASVVVEPTHAAVAEPATAAAAEPATAAAAEKPAASEPVLAAIAAEKPAAVEKAASAEKPAAAAATASAPKPRESVKDLRHVLSDTEAAFFDTPEQAHAEPPAETFDDLDEGYTKPSFWDRVFNRKPRR